ncbi:hypothetical protein RESH_05309 [Rhodopirellula europaea SH398]|uniref:Uncharacterized protein n=1 Tax=Rhodopirellula europaea SH398 TaxID=1263868 RepID=M5RXL6_9BACT|nr:hypothetical protein RESH_05309 [Rhodopirellula europaea SH398]
MASFSIIRRSAFAAVCFHFSLSSLCKIGESPVHESKAFSRWSGRLACTTGHRSACHAPQR